MKIIAKRPFISSRVGVGNVPEGRILDIEDNYAKTLINAGLAEEYSVSPALRAAGQPSFTSPVEASAGSGPSSQVAPASLSQTATRSRRGAKKAKTAK